jgi:hypothetical protein
VEKWTWFLSLKIPIEKNAKISHFKIGQLFSIEFSLKVKMRHVFRAGLPDMLTLVSTCWLFGEKKMKSQQVLTFRKNFLPYFYRRLLNFCLNFNTLLTFADFFADFFKNRSGSPVLIYKFCWIKKPGWLNSRSDDVVWVRIKFATWKFLSIFYLSFC